MMYRLVVFSGFCYRVTVEMSVCLLVISVAETEHPLLHSVCAWMT